MLLVQFGMPSSSNTLEILLVSSTVEGMATKMSKCSPTIQAAHAMYKVLIVLLETPLSSSRALKELLVATYLRLTRILRGSSVWGGGHVSHRLI